MNNGNRYGFSYAKESGIYCFINTENRKRYVGQAISLDSRIKQHFRDLRANRDLSPLLQRAWNKYGLEKFEIIILECCSIDDLDDREKFYIDKLKTTDRNKGYNILIGGRVLRGKDHPNFQRAVSEETRKKQSESHKNKKHSEESKNKISEKLKGHPVSDETRKKISLGNIGKLLGRILPKSVCEKISIANTGKKTPVGIVEKIGDKQRGTKRGNRTSKYIGVCKNDYIRKDGTTQWVAQVSISGKSFRIGRYNTEVEAAKAYNKYVIENNIKSPLNNLK